MVVAVKNVATICICNYSFSPKGAGKAEVGQWIKVNENMSDASRAYQRYITGTDEVWLKNGVKFDGINNGRLIEAKGNYSNFVDNNTGSFYEWFEGQDSLVNQANRQLHAAEGSPIDWYFSDTVSMNATKGLFQREGINGINMVLKSMK